MTEPNTLKQSLENPKHGPMERKPAASDPQTLIDTCKRLLRQQQERLVAARSRYETDRTERANWYRSEMSKVADEAESEMAMIDKGWHEEEAKISLIIRQVKALLAV